VQHESPDLSGHWRATLWTLDGKDTIHGTIVLARDSIEAARCSKQTARGAICSSLAAGTHNLPVSQLVEHQFGDTVQGAVDDANRVLFRLGGCCDIGELEATARYRADSLRGKWEETRVGLSHYKGRFLFVRDKP
jgi:hypothetical protein